MYAYIHDLCMHTHGQLCMHTYIIQVCIRACIYVCIHADVLPFQPSIQFAGPRRVAPVAVAVACRSAVARRAGCRRSWGSQLGELNLRAYRGG